MQRLRSAWGEFHLGAAHLIYMNPTCAETACVLVHSTGSDQYALLLTGLSITLITAVSFLVIWWKSMPNVFERNYERAVTDWIVFYAVSSALVGGLGVLLAGGSGFLRQAAACVAGIAIADLLAYAIRRARRAGYTEATAEKADLLR